jgi:hypothetical protein
MQLAMFDYNVFYNSANPTAAMLLFIAFEVTGGHPCTCMCCISAE